MAKGKKEAKQGLTRAQKIGLTIILVSILVPGLFWGILLLMEATKNYCSECSVGWAAVIFTWLAIPTIFIGLLTLTIATLVKASKRSSD